MKVRELREGLALLTKLLSGWQAKSAAGDLERLAVLFERHDDLSVAEFCSAVEKSLAGGSQTPSRQKPSDGASVELLLQELRQAEGSHELFESVLARIEKMRTADLHALANAYSGSEGSYRKKADAIRAIREKRGEDGSLERQLKSVHGIF